MVMASQEQQFIPFTGALGGQCVPGTCIVQNWVSHYLTIVLGSKY
jgi:hypothetical protein